MRRLSAASAPRESANALGKGFYRFLLPAFFTVFDFLILSAFGKKSDFSSFFSPFSVSHFFAVFGYLWKTCLFRTKTKVFHFSTPKSKQMLKTMLITFGKADNFKVFPQQKSLVINTFNIFGVENFFCDFFDFLHFSLLTKNIPI